MPFSATACASVVSKPTASFTAPTVSSKKSPRPMRRAAVRAALARVQGCCARKTPRTSAGTAIGTERRSTVTRALSVRTVPPASRTVSVTVKLPARGKAWIASGPLCCGVPSPKSQLTEVPPGRSCAVPNRCGTPEPTVRAPPAEGAMRFTQEAQSSAAQAARASRMAVLYHRAAGPALTGSPAAASSFRNF